MVERLPATLLAVEPVLPLYSDPLSELARSHPLTLYLLQKDLNSGRRVRREVLRNLLLQGQVLRIIAALDPDIILERKSILSLLSVSNLTKINYVHCIFYDNFSKHVHGIRYLETVACTQIVLGVSSAKSTLKVRPIAFAMRAKSSSGTRRKPKRKVAPQCCLFLMNVSLSMMGLMGASVAKK